MFHARTKHIAIDAHHIRDQVTNKHLAIQYVPIEFQKADMLAKPLAAGKFTTLRQALNLCSIETFRDNAMSKVDN